MNKTDAYRNRRYKRLLARMDDADGHFDDEGHWVTTHETKRHIHINENGVPDKGNPYIIAKMTGTKPKLSPEYRKKSLQEDLIAGKTLKAVHALKSLPEGSTITAANGTTYTKTGSGFVSSKGKQGVKQTPQALAKILGGHAKAGKEFNVNPSDIEGFIPPEKNTGAPMPGQGAPNQTAQDIKEKMMSTMSAAMASQDIDGVQKVVEMFEQLPVGSVVTDAYGSEYKKLPNGEFEDTSIPLSSISSVDMPSIVKTAISKGGEVGITLPEDGTSSSTAGASSNAAATQYSAAKTAIEEGVLSGDESAIEKGLNDLPDGSVIKFTSGSGSEFEYTKTNGQFVEKDIGVKPPWSIASWLSDPDTTKQTIEMPGDSVTSESASTSSPEIDALNAVIDQWGAGNQVPAVTSLHALTGLQDGTKITIDGTTYEKQSEVSTFGTGKVTSFKNTETGEVLDKAAFKAALKSSAEGGSQHNIEVQAPGQPTPASSGGKTMKDLMESLKKYPTTMEGANQFWGEVKSTFENAPDGTEITFPDEAGEKWVKETHGGLPQWVNSTSGDTIYDADMVQSFMDSDFGADPDNISAGITYKEPTGAETPGSSSSTPSSPVSQDYSSQKEALNNLIKNGHNASITPYEKVLDELPEGTIIKVGGKKYEKDPTGDWSDSDTGEPLGESWDVGYELEHNNPQHTLDISIPGENTAASSATSANSPAGQSSAVSAALSGVQSIADKLQNGKYVSLSDFKNACKSMEDGDGIVMNGQTYVKDTDSSGNPVFHPSDSPQQTFNPTGVMDIMSYQIGLQKHGLSNGVSFKSGSDQSNSGSTTGVSPGTATPASKPSVAAKDTQKSIKNAKTKAAVASALDALPVGTKIHMKNQGETVFTKTEHGFSKESKLWGGAVYALTDDVVKYVHGKNKYAAPFAIEDTSGGTTDFSDGSSYKAPAYSSTASLQSQSSSSSSSPNSTSSPKPSAWAGLKAKVQHAAEAFTQARKNAAHWDKGNGMATDKLMRPVAGAVWKTLNSSQKHSLVAYTGSSYSSINDALRNGTGKRAEDIKNITEAIDKCEAPTDIWLQRGCSSHGLCKLFNVSPSDLEKARSKGSQAVLDLLTTSADYAQDKAFLSCGSSKGKGFSSSNVIMNLYCPKGTKMIYAEPFSIFGATGVTTGWDGVSGTTHVSGEHETLLQRGTMLRPTKVTVSNGKIYVDVDVIGQNY